MDYSNKILPDAQGRVWIRRDPEGKITTASHSRDSEDGWEAVAPDDPELLAYEKVVEQTVRELDKKFPGRAQRGKALFDFIMAEPDSDDEPN